MIVCKYRLANSDLWWWWQVVSLHFMVWWCVIIGPENFVASGTYFLM